MSWFYKKRILVSDKKFIRINKIDRILLETNKKILFHNKFLLKFIDLFVVIYKKVIFKLKNIFIKIYD